MSRSFPDFSVLLATKSDETFTDMLPGDFDLSFEHDFVDVLVKLKSPGDDGWVFAAIKVADHLEEFSNIRDYQGVSFLNGGK